jgi:hypothetical protein
MWIRFSAAIRVVWQAQSGFADGWKLTRGKTGTIIGVIILQRFIPKITISWQKKELG